MMTVYLNREIDGSLDLYITSGTVYRTGNSQYSNNSRDGFKILVGTFRERKDDPRTADSRAVQAMREWMAAYMIAKIPVQSGSDVALAYEADPSEVQERPMRKPRISVM
jgi:hypothetical protein